MNRMHRIIKLRFDGVILSKKNRHIISRNGGIIVDNKAQANEDDMVQQFVTQLRKQGINDAFFMTTTQKLELANKRHERYAIRFDIWRANNIRRDLDNQVTTLLDALTKAFAIADDSHKYLKQIVATDKGIDRQNPRAEIEINVFADKGGE